LPGVFVIRTVMPRESEGSPASRAITALAMRFSSLLASQVASDKCTLELMFVLPDEEGPLFEGMRLGSYAEGTHTLCVQAAVPARLVASARAADYVAAAAADAVDAAGEFFGEQGVPFNADARREILRSISVTELERRLESRNLPESTWVDAAASGGPRAPS
jgi:hypothetical protein